MEKDHKVTLSLPWTDADGVKHKADETISVDRATANTLVHAGRARKADKAAPAAKRSRARKPAAKKAAAPAADSKKEG